MQSRRRKSSPKIYPKNQSTSDTHTTEHSHAASPLKKGRWYNRQPGQTQHVNHMWCCTTTTMRGCSKHTLKCPSPNHGKTRSHSRPSMLWNTHGLQAHGRTIHGTPTTRSNTTRQPHVVPDINNKHAAIEQENIKIPNTKQCIMKVWTSTIQITRYSLAASPFKNGNWATIVNQGKLNMSTTCGAAQQPPCDGAASTR